MERRLLKPKEVAELLRVHRITVTEWIRKGKIRAVRVGKLWRIPDDEVKRVLKHGLGDG